MISDLRYLSFEVSQQCNLAAEHTFCPAATMLRSVTAVTDNQIATFAHEMVSRGFEGEIAWHYYNEPLTDVPRIESLMKAIDYNRFCLWTNGLLLTEEHLPLLRRHTSVIVTLHHPEDRPRLEKLLCGIPHASICKAEYDDRIDIYGTSPRRDSRYCMRPVSIEMPVDYGGDVHLCCGDWKGTIPIGNIDTPNDTISRWLFMADLTGQLALFRKCVSLYKGPFAG